MGSITSRKNWPPEPEKNPARYVYELVLVDGKWTKRLVLKRRGDDRRQKAGR